jgi:hypothetical protein
MIINKISIYLLIFLLLLSGFNTIGYTSTTSQDNDSPKINNDAPSELIFFEDSVKQYINLYNIFNKSNSTIIFTILNGTAWVKQYNSNILLANILSNNTIEITFHPNQFGQVKLIIKASNENGSVNHELLISVLSVNDPPIIETIGNKTINNTDIIEFSIELGNWFNTTVSASDIDSESLVYYDNTSLFNIDEVNGTISFKPNNNEVGVYIIQIKVSDLNGSNSESWIILKLIVKNINNPPIAQIISPKNESEFFDNETITLNGYGTDPDLKFGDYLTYTWYSNVKGYLGNGKKLSLENLSLGWQNITLKITDSEGLFHTTKTSIFIKSSYLSNPYIVWVGHENDYVLIKQNEIKKIEVYVKNDGYEKNEISIDFKLDPKFKGSVKSELSKVVLEPYRYKKFNLTLISNKTNKIGFYILEITGKSQISPDDKYYSSDVMDNEVIRIFVIENSTHKKNKIAQKPKWQVGTEWKYKIAREPDPYYWQEKKYGLLTTKLTNTSSIQINQTTYNIFQMELKCDMQKLDKNSTLDESKQVYGHYYNGIGYYNSINLDLIRLYTNIEESIEWYPGEKTTKYKKSNTFYPPIKEYDFPINPGECWYTDTISKVEFNNQSFGISEVGSVSENYSIGYICLGTEQITIPSGTYDTFLILKLWDFRYHGDLTEYFNKCCTRSKLLDFKDDYFPFTIDYYSPSIGFTVKQIKYIEKRHYDPEDEEIELLYWKEFEEIELISYSIPKNDINNDKIPDYWEYSFNIDSSNADNDNDNFTNFEEYINGTNPLNPLDNPKTPIDTDNDYIPDNWELYYNFNPDDSNDADKDYDNDGYSNLKEYLYLTSPRDPDDKPQKPNDKDPSPQSIEITDSEIIWIIFTVVIVIILIVLAIVTRQTKNKNKKQ